MTHKIRWYGIMFALLLLALLIVVAWVVGEERLFTRDAEDTLRFARAKLQVLSSARHDHYELRCNLAATPGSALHGGELLLAFGVRGVDDGALLRWNQRGLFLNQRRAGKETALAETPTTLSESLASSSDLLIRVMNDEVEVVFGGRRLLRVFAPTLGRGAVACGYDRKHVAVSDLRYQRLEPFRFADDFMRTEEEAKEWGQWRPLSGDWKIYSVMERIHDNPAANIRKGREPLADRSPNPFCLSGSAPDGPGMIVTGLPFWCDYQAAVSVKPFGGAFGLVFGFRDAENYWLLRWSADSLAPSPAPLELVLREQGVERVIASVMLAGRAENWWRLGIRQQGDRVDALVDGVLVLSCRDQASVGGAVGLYKDGAQEAYFDDLELTSVSDIAHRRLLSEAGRALVGKWRLADEGVAEQGADAGDVLTVIADGGTAAVVDGLPGALYQVGWPHWAPQRFAATVLPAAAEQSQVTAGLVFGLHDEQNYWRAGWTPGKGGRLFMQQVRDGHAEEALTLPYAWSGGEPLRLAVDSRQEGVLELWANELLVLRKRLAMDAGAQDAAIAGAVGLFGAKGAGFAKVCAFAELPRDWEQPVDIARFADDPFMQGWASSRYSWLRDDGDGSDYPRRYRHNGDFYGAFTLIAPLQGGFKVFWGLDDLQPANGYALLCELSAETGAGSVTLQRGAETLAEAAFSGKTRSVLPGKQIVDEKIGAQPRTPDTESWGRLELRRDGHAIWVVLDGEELFCVHEPTPLIGRCFGVEVPAAMDFIHLDICRESLRDYLFERAETDWNSLGRWEVTNRFACDPRWSHMNGESRGVAALWSKFVLTGDFTIECFAGMRMRQGELHEGAQMSYPRVGDINVAINGDGRELFSGYNLLVAAWDERWSETWTQFWRRDTMVAQTDRELIPRGRHLTPRTRAVAQEWDPGGRPVHGAWYALKIRRTGSRYDVSFDNTPVFSYTDDDEPIPGGKLSLWTQHNSIVLARVKVSYRELRPQAPLPAALPGDQQGQAPMSVAIPIDTEVGAETAPALPPLLLASHPTHLIDFEDGLGGIEPWYGDQSAQLRRQRHDERSGMVLAATNINSGGDFGLALPWADIALHRVAELRLACQISGGSLVNFYFTVKDDPVGRYFIRLTGPGHDEANLHCVGVAEGLRVGEWSELRVPIGELLRARFPRRDQWVLDSAMIGMLHEGYLNAGLGGNHADAKYYLDDIALVGYGPQSVTCQWQLAEGQQAPSCHAWISQEPVAAAVPEGAALFSDASFTLTAPQPGLGWLQVETLAADAAPARRLPPMPLQLAASPASLRVQPADGENWGLNPIRVTLPPDKLAWPRLGSLVLCVNEQCLPIHEGNSVLDVATGVLEIQPMFAAKMEADAEGMVACTLSYLPADAPEKGEPMQQSWRLRLKPADDRTPPGLPQLKDALGALCGLRPWQEEGKIANAKSQVDIQRYRLPDGTPAARITNRICGSDFGFSFGLPTFEIARFPVLLFDYKISPDSHIDLLLRVLGKMHTIGLTDLDPSRGLRLGECSGIVADDCWHSAQLDLREYCGDLSVTYDGTGLATTDVALGNWHYSGEAAGNYYEVSRVMLAPLVNSCDAPPQLSWHLPDPGDIVAYSFQWDRERDSIPDTKSEGAATSTTMPALADGLHFFHIRGCDQAGNWGATAHYPFMVENGLPQIVSVSPEDGSAAAPEQIEMSFADDGTNWLDFSKVKIKINGEERRLDRYSLAWDHAQRRFSWNLLRDWRLLNKAVADGTVFTAEVSGIRTFAGREVPVKSWQWRLDYAQDKTPPQPPMVVGNDNVFQNTESFSGSHNWRSQPQTKLDIVQDDSIGSRCLEIRHYAKDGGRFQANAWLRRDLLKSCQALRFRYQIAPGTKVNLLLLIEREWYAVRMTGSDEAPIIGAIADARDDGQWRWAWLDLPELIAKAVPDNAEASLMQVAFGERGAAAAENVLRIDDFSAVGVFGPLPLLNLHRTDASGIAAYEAKLSKVADDEPQLAMSAKAGRQTLQAVDQAGLWFVHARCRDGAGNTSETIHLPFLCHEPASAQADGDGWEAAAEGTWRLRAIQRSQSPNATYWPIRAGENNHLLGVQFYGGRSLPMELYRELPEDTADAWKNGVGVDLFLQGAGEVEVRAALYVADQRRPILSEPLNIEGGTWQRDQRLTFAAEDLPKDAPRHIALRFKRNERGQAVLLVDACRWLP